MPMKKIAVITDTDSSLPPAVAAQYSIRQVPITIHFNEETYTTGVDIDDRKVFQLIDQRKKLPTTSAPSPSAFAAAYQEAFDDGAEAVICICVSSKVSATFGSAVTAQAEFPGKEIRVIDSQQLSMGQGFMVLAAARAVERGADVEEAAAAAEEIGRRVHVYALLSTLKYLALSGRVGKLVAGMADTLNIKPILTVKEGKLDLLERIRTRKKAQERLLELCCEAVSDKAIEQAAIIHITDPQGAEEFQRLLRAKLACPAEILTTEFTPGLAVHAGSGVVGVVLVAAP